MINISLTAGIIIIFIAGFTVGILLGYILGGESIND